MGLWAALWCKPPPCHHHPGSCRARSARPPQPHPRSLLPRGHPSMCHCPFRSVTGGRHHQGARTRCSEKCPHSWGSSGGFAGTGGVGLTLKQRRLLGRFYLWCPMSFHGGVAGERKHLKVQSLFLIAALVSASRRVHHQLSSYSCPGCVARRRSLLHDADPEPPQRQPEPPPPQGLATTSSCLGPSLPDSWKQLKAILQTAGWREGAAGGAEAGRTSLTVPEGCERLQRQSWQRDWDGDGRGASSGCRCSDGGSMGHHLEGVWGEHPPGLGAGPSPGMPAGPQWGTGEPTSSLPLAHQLTGKLSGRPEKSQPL
ncbi:uncharacterized protein LOC142364218 [Opisthocomus hoazin]|uniref:uncharacterized protein LOC142364218 n=1 Tax=Opisthocomus hoazin TaxID=30419 RepID=UPI003F533C9E